MEDISFTIETERSGTRSQVGVRILQGGLVILREGRYNSATRRVEVGQIELDAGGMEQLIDAWEKWRDSD